jgi:hypothetical protein
MFNDMISAVRAHFTDDAFTLLLLLVSPMLFGVLTIGLFRQGNSATKVFNDFVARCGLYIASFAFSAARVVNAKAATPINFSLLLFAILGVIVAVFSAPPPKKPDSIAFGRLFINGVLLALAIWICFRIVIAKA